MLTIRIASESDLEAIIGLHAADLIGGHGDMWTEETEAGYRAAFHKIHSHPDHELYVAEDEGRIVGSFMVSLLPGITSRGAVHAELRSVQVDPTLRSRGIGAEMVAFAEAEARRRGAKSLTLTSSLKRVDAHRFYERLGFERSHAGFRKFL